MIVKFRESYYNWYKLEPLCNSGPISSWQPLMSEDMYNIELEAIGILIEILKDKFKSIVFSPAIPDNFQFKDNADEAVFLLWSSDGIEI